MYIYLSVRTHMHTKTNVNWQVLYNLEGVYTNVCSRQSWGVVRRAGEDDTLRQSVGVSSAMLEHPHPKVRTRGNVWWQMVNAFHNLGMHVTYVEYTYVMNAFIMYTIIAKVKDHLSRWF